MSNSESDRVIAETGARPGVAVTVGALVAELVPVLAAAGVPAAATEARDIVAAVLDMPRLWPSAHRDEIIDDEARSAARAAGRKRASGAPFAYAVGRAAFRHLTLDVDERVLIPRQETEVLVEEVLARAGQGGVAIDIGTGSGAIALSLALEGRFDRVIGTDISRGALTVAQANTDRLALSLRAPVELRCGASLAPVRAVRARVVVSNPPYIAHREAPALPSSVRDWEPPVALFAADDGMAMIAALVREAGTIVEPGGLLALEVDSRRASLAAELAMACDAWRDVSVAYDLAGRERILLAVRRSS
jgi:release factor glutamine methyltransferase